MSLHPPTCCFISECQVGGVCVIGCVPFPIPFFSFLVTQLCKGHAVLQMASECTEGDRMMSTGLLSVRECSLPVTFSILLLAVAAALHQAAIQDVLSGIMFSQENGCACGKHVGIVRPAVMLALEKGSARRSTSHYVEMNHFNLTDVSVLIMYMREKCPLLLQACELRVRPVLNHMSWAVRLVQWNPH